MHLVLQEQFTEWLMTMQIIRQDRHTPRLKALGIALYPSFDGLLLAILFLVPG
jgi:heme/copper-type cytochrome/quinol oxidase subunit 1